jgi:hypothetical protein
MCFNGRYRMFKESGTVDQTFTPRQVLQALGIAHGTLNAWAHRGLLRGLSGAITTPGKARRFTVSDLTALGIMKQLIDLGLGAERSRELARLSVLYMEVADTDEFDFFIGADDNPALLVNEPVGPRGAGVKLTIYPRAIIAAMKAKLAAVDDAGDEEAEG